MRRRMALAGSLFVHGTIALGLAALAVHRPTVRPPAWPKDITIELAAPVAPIPQTPPPVDVAGGPPGGRVPAPPRAPRQARTVAPRAAAPSPRTVETTMRIEPPSSATGRASGAGAVEGGELGDPAAGPGGPAAGGDGGGGLGGLVLGAGARFDAAVIAGPLPMPTPEPAPARSRARAPQLIYPARDREADDAAVFVARLTIDTDGFVVGARLVRGLGGRRDDQAAGAVWRFRYRPALDAGGRPIQATIEQRFLVE